MKTKVDDAISRFMAVLIETDDIEKELQILLDTVRIQYGFDVVYIMEKVASDTVFTYTYASVSKPEYDQRGAHIRVSDEDYEVGLHMYDDAPICGTNVNAVKDYNISDCIIHYGFVRKKMNSYDGSIGFQCFTPHIWTEEEKSVLLKLGKLYKMMISVPIAEGINENFYEKLERERKQYRDALIQGSEYNFTVDVTEGLIREKIFNARGEEILEDLGITILPVQYDQANQAFLEKYQIRLLDESTRSFFSCKGLIEGYEKGMINPELEYYRPLTDTYIRVNVFMYKDRQNGHIYGLFMATDITETKRRQEEQKKALEDAYHAANQANEAKSRFLSNMSHDIRTPMNGIIGMTAIAGTHIDDKGRVMDCLSKITLASKHLLGLINDILDMSKIESGKIELQNEEFSLPQIIDNLLVISKPQIEAKHHKFSVSLKNIEHEKVIGDSQRLEQVFLNLLSNAIKYTPDGGRISLIITEKPICKAKSGCYEFVLEDNGIGMSKEYMEHLFDPFSRASDNRASNMQGTGLGMSITKNIVQMMNGTIKVESELDRGTKFMVTVFLELQEVEEPIVSDQFLDLPILVADDDEMACQSACEILEELGMKGEYVLTGEQAVKRVVERHQAKDDYFAVILDWKMPEMDGIEITRRIRKRVGKKIPIIIISAYDWSEIEVSAKAAGADMFLSKPLFKSRVAYLFKKLLSDEEHMEDMSALKEVQKSNFSDKRALVVEDNELNAEIAGEILGMANIDIEYAKDGKEAVDCIASAEAGYYDIIFMDIQMPIMDGYEATRTIRSLPGDYAKQVPIIAMTANAFMEDVQRCKDAGMNEHISKPMDFERLLKTLNHWLG